MEHIMLNEHKVKKEKDGGQPSSYWDRDLVAVEKIKQKFETLSKVGHPKIITLHEAQEAGIVQTRGYYQEAEMTPLEAYGYAWLENAYKMEYPTSPKTKHEEWGNWLMKPIENQVFHCIKIQWLVDIIQTVGLYACPQAALRASEWYCHPGQFRVHALTYTDCNEDFIVWDINETLPQPEIDYEEWWSRFDVHTDKGLFAAVLEDVVEMHVGESRQDLYDKVAVSVDCFQGVKPILEGTCDERISHIFTHGTYEGHGIGIVGHFTFEDLKHGCGFNSKKPVLSKENFTLYNNYHK